ncbi:hypothetical protein BOX15_Mlig028452g3 [Macrostomum lignano]|uniref:WSC domain-containing protein n=2 Tax=Macrostomum lignano TaxID=282301 RepID=A0A267G769_9PLAT|nr:hypothetical protein BOX15_Mlig028452g3 [Macrostomum lignano]
MRPIVSGLLAVACLLGLIGQAAAETGASPPTYTSIGCYRDTGEHDLPFLMEIKPTTVYRCRDKCRQLRYRYSANQYSDQCWCGNKYGRYGKNADSECPMKCNANKEQLCGGVWHQHIYATGVGEAALSIKPLGCFVDKPDHDLPFLSAGKIDVNSCIKRCTDYGYKYAGLQVGAQCWCGISHGRYGKASDSECSTPCAANKLQLCGGVWHNLIYETGFTPSERENLGCYIDKGIHDMLEFKAGTISIEYCRRYCYNLGYKYLGVQYASQCFCGNKYGRYGKGAAHTCSMACNGKKDEICGGVWRNNVYATGREAEEFHSIGCYHDKAVRDLPFLSKSGAITLNNCRLECASYGFLYFGVQNSNLCFCGNKYGRYGKAADGACNKQCIGNKEQTCGGYFLNSIYPTNVEAHMGSDSGSAAQSASDEKESSLIQGVKSDTIGKIVTISQIEMRKFGCYKDRAQRDLPQLAFTGTLSVHYCRWTCRQLKYRYFGLQAISHCFCGNGFGQYGQGDDSKCNFKCGANKDQICGGTWYNSLYATGVSVEAAEMKPLGCYVDKPDRDLPVLGSHCPIISVNKCVTSCADLGFKYAGAQAGAWCYCGNKFGRYGKAVDSNCYVRCHANRRQICGGIWHQHIYETKADITNPENLGCYRDKGIHDLVEMPFSGVISINYCRKLCRELGYRYAGVQYSVQCWCGNKYGRYGKADPSKCNMKCTGHNEQICGGVWHQNIYESGKPAFLFKSMGCYNDKVVRDLPFLAKIGLVTLNNCRQACWRYGFKYFGVQNSNLCYCGDTYNKYGKVDDVRCQKRCLGNKAQICGDLWLNNIYETGIGGSDESDYTRETESEKSEEQTVPDEESTIIDGNTDNEPSIDKDTDSGADTTIQHKGCFVDKKDRDLPDLVFTGTVTIQLCVRLCARRLYRYAGLQAGSQCFCGDSFGRHGHADSEDKCHTRCRGNAQQFCGGAFFNTINSTGLAWKFTAKGCFKDEAARDLPIVGMSGQISVNRCFRRCRDLGYFYAGVQNSMQCFCGNYYNQYGKAEDSECNAKCRGNPYQTCGGAWRNNIYRTTFEEIHRTAVGCFKDKADHDLPEFVETGLMTVNLCLNRCSELGYKYAGLQEGNTCYCGNSYGRYGKGDPTICFTMCSGNSNQMCGGTHYNLVFETGVTVNEFSSLGTFLDKTTDRDLPFLVRKVKTNLNNCRKLCRRYGFIFFGVQNGNECRCGNSYGKHGQIQDASSGIMNCDGDSSQQCGGSLMQTVYSTGLTKDAIIISEGISSTESITGEVTEIFLGDVTTISSWTTTSTTTNTVIGGTTVISYEYIWTTVGSDAIHQLAFGCFKDSADRDLPTMAETSDAMTVKRCVKLCQDRQFKFAGLQNGKECWCGQQFGKYGPGLQTSCDKDCAGDASMKCGGGWHNSVYTTSLENLQGMSNIVVSETTQQTLIGSAPQKK